MRTPRGACRLVYHRRQARASKTRTASTNIPSGDSAAPGGMNGWLRISTLGTAPNGASLAAVTHNPAKIDLFLTGNDSAVWTSWWGADGVITNQQPSIRVFDKRHQLG